MNNFNVEILNSDPTGCLPRPEFGTSSQRGQHTKALRNHCPGSSLRMTSGSGRGTSGDHLTALNHHSYSFSEAYCEPSIVLSTYHILSHFILTIILDRRKYYCYYFNYYYLLSSDELQGRNLEWQQLHSLEQKHCPSRLDHWHSNLNRSVVIFAPGSGLTSQLPL